MARLFSQAAAGIGWAVSVYLYFAKKAGEFVCPAGDCQTVNSSEYAQIGPMPVSFIGILYYLAVLGLLFKPPFFSDKTAQAMLGILLIAGLIFSAYLTYAEFFWIHAVCFWCMVSFGCVIALNILHWSGRWSKKGMPLDQ